MLYQLADPPPASNGYAGLSSPSADQGWSRPYRGGQDAIRPEYTGVSPSVNSVVASGEKNIMGDPRTQKVPIKADPYVGVQRPKMQSTRLDQNGDSDHPAAPTESELLRDLPFTLQGLSTTNLSFSSPTMLRLPPTLPLPIISLLHTLAEPALLYRNLSDFVQSSEDGLMGQSLRSAVGNELRSYLGLIATLEGEIRKALSSLENNEVQGKIGKAGVTLKRCVVWTREATLGLRLMSVMVEESKSRRSLLYVGLCANCFQQGKADR